MELRNLLIMGSTAAAVLLAYKVFGTKKVLSIVFFTEDDSRIAALMQQTLSSKFDVQLINGTVSSVPKSSIIIELGGQAVNPDYRSLVNQGVLPELKEGMKPTAIVKQVGNTLFIAGINPQDTIDAARRLLISGDWQSW